MVEVKKKSITMKDVAAEAGVSVGTVSRVINKEKGIKDVTLRKVRQAIETLHYIPDNYARGMKTNRTETIALIVPTVWHPFFSEFAMYIEREVSKRGNKLLLCSIDGSQKELDYIRMMQQNKVDGIVAITYSPIEHYLASGIPFVSVDRSYSNTDIACVSSDNEAGAIEAAKRLIEKGCKKLAFVGNHNDTSNETKKRHYAFENYVKIEGHSCVVFDLHEQTDAFKEKMQSFLVDNEDIDGIFAINDFMALDVIRLLEKNGKRVPEDVQVIGYDGIRMAKDREVLVSTIQQPVEQMAVEAISILFDIIEGAQYRLQTILPIKYIEGKSTKN